MASVRETAAARAPAHASGGARAMRALRWFWIATGVVVVGGIGTLQFLGPLPRTAIKPALVPPPPSLAPRVPLPPTAPAANAAPTGATAAALAAPAPPQPASRAEPPAPAAPPTPAPAEPVKADEPAPVVPIRAPDAALLEPAPDYTGAMLPRVAQDGRKAMQVYAAAFNRVDPRPRIAMLLGGIGQSEADSEDAVSVLPPAVSFVVSPYAPRPDKLLEDIRAHGHEFLVGIPMEPANNPVNSEGSFQLMTGAMPEQNARNLEWALSRVQGYVGTTNALDGLRGERFSASSQQMQPVLQELARRGVFYIDAVPAANRPAAASVAALATRVVDMVIDEPPVRAEIEQKLTQLEQVARDRGVAVGLAGLPRPVVIARIAAWAGGLGARGLALAPISTIVRFPPPGPGRPPLSSAGSPPGMPTMPPAVSR